MTTDSSLRRILLASVMRQLQRRLRIALKRCTKHKSTRFRIKTAATEQVEELVEGQVYLDALQTYFGIELDVSYEAIRPLTE